MSVAEVITTEFKSAGGITSLSHFKQQQLITLHLLFKKKDNKYKPPPPNNPTKDKINVSSSHTGKVIIL